MVNLASAGSRFLTSWIVLAHLARAQKVHVSRIYVQTIILLTKTRQDPRETYQRCRLNLQCFSHWSELRSHRPPRPTEVHGLLLRENESFGPSFRGHQVTIVLEVSLVVLPRKTNAYFIRPNMRVVNKLSEGRVFLVGGM